MSRRTVRGSHRALALALLVAAAFFSAPSPSAASSCRAALVLALDISKSVDRRERALQADGLALALTSEDVRAAILAPGGAVTAAAFVWSGGLQQTLIADWSRLDSAAAIDRFAAEIAARGALHSGRATAVGEALAYAAALHRRNPARCATKIVDVSGDGVGNNGRPPSAFRASGALNGLQINGLVIRGRSRAPIDYYRRNVIQGPGAFVIDVASYRDYAAAMEKKLLRELSPAAVQLAPARSGPRRRGPPQGRRG